MHRGKENGFFSKRSHYGSSPLLKKALDYGQSNKTGEFFERSAWVLFLVIGVLEILFGWGDMIAGVENDPAILISITGNTPAELKAQDPVFYAAMDHQQKIIGQILWITGALISIISLTAFRHGALGMVHVLVDPGEYGHRCGLIV